MTLPSHETVAEAAAWITRLHGSRRSPEVEAGFRAWLTADAMHARAFEGMTEIWDTVPAVPAGELPRVTVWQPRPGTAVRMRRWAVAAVCVMAVATYVFLRDPTYVTATGEQRVVNLEDGTRVTLNTDTRMTVDYNERARRIVLKRGEAYFEVAHNRHAPFSVAVGDHGVLALGTTFAIRQDPDRTAVTLIEGSVRADAVTLAPGQRLTLISGADPRIDTPRIDLLMAWRRGELILDDIPLAEAAAEMNRYSRVPIVIDDPAHATLALSGIYRTGDSLGFAQLVSQVYGLKVSGSNREIRLTGRPRPPAR